MVEAGMQRDQGKKNRRVATMLFANPMSGELSEDEYLFRFEDENQAKEYFLKRLHGLTISGFKEKRFGDFWIRVYEKPESNFFAGIECHIKAPGQHPGGNCYWVKPIEPILVPIFDETDDE